MIRNHSRHGSRFPVTSTSAPGAPTIGTATATGATTATVSFTQPANNGGSTITSYTATSSPGGITGVLNQAGSGTITVTGLTSSTSYTFTVTATNAIGTSAPSAASNSITTVATDPYWANVSMLLHGDGVNGGQNNTFLDGSTNNATVTRNGNTTQGSFNPFTPVYPYAVATNGGSGYFDGTGDYLSVPAAAPLTIPTGSFTIEMWIYRSGNGSGGSSNYDSLMGSNLGMSSVFGIYVNRTTLAIGFYGNATLVETSTSISNNAWTHIAVSRTSGNNLQIFINGVSGYSAANVTAGAFTNPLYIGYDGVAANYLYYGYISNLRYLTGTTLYTSNFTPPTAPLTAVTNTALLLGMSNGAIYDNAELNNLETVADAQINTTTFKFGTGSIKMDGIGDYLLVADSTPLNYGTGNFTIEMWVNPTSFGIGVLVYAKVDTTAGAPNNGWFIEILSTGAVLFGYGTSSSSYYLTTSASFTTGSWQHLACVRQGAVVTVYRDGTSVGAATLADAASHDKVGSPLYIGQYQSNASYNYNGYIDEYRITKGVARYTTTFTPPTAAFPNS